MLLILDSRFNKNRQRSGTQQDTLADHNSLVNNAVVIAEQEKIC